MMVAYLVDRVNTTMSLDDFLYEERVNKEVDPSANDTDVYAFFRNNIVLI